MFEEVLATRPPPSMGGRGVRFSYQRFVVNQIRERFGLRDEELAVRRRVTKGRSVMAACGQLGNAELRRGRALPVAR